MKLIVGLGNPGKQYNFTRHNFGFLALDFLSKIQGWEWEKQPKFNAVWSKQGSTIFIKPQTFYNEAGRAVQAFTHYYKIDPTDILIIHDDFDLDFGKIRYREKGSSGGNNGLKSIIRELGTDVIPRLKLGSNNANLRKKMKDDADFVLGHFTSEEHTQLPTILKEACSHINDFNAHALE